MEEMDFNIPPFEETDPEFAAELKRIYELVDKFIAKLAEVRERQREWRNRWGKLERNDLCPVCGVKIKKCEHSNLI
jgi:hypothetical protein